MCCTAVPAGRVPQQSTSLPPAQGMRLFLHLHRGGRRARRLKWQQSFFSSASYFVSDRFIHFSFSAALLKPQTPFMTVLIFYQFREL